jgi:hypothetical protein
MLRNWGTAGNATACSDYPVAMRRLCTAVLRTALVVVAAGVVRALVLDRAPRRALHGTAPLIGSVDTWPKVPRRPTG